MNDVTVYLILSIFIVLFIALLIIITLYLLLMKESITSLQYANIKNATLDITGMLIILAMLSLGIYNLALTI